MHICVCICTFQRPDLLKQTLTEVSKQNTQGLFTFSVVVVDNDAAESAEPVVREMSVRYPVELTYCVEPRRNIAYARNQTIARSQGDTIAFIDDDEFPEPDWLANLLQTLRQHKAAGVLGPVRPFYPDGTPAWVRQGGFFVRPEHPTGFVMPWAECRTGNVLFARSIISGLDPVFSPEFGTGGSDVDFFRRMVAAGHSFVWCNEAVVHETVAPSRWNRSVLIKRALLRGRNSFRHPVGRWKNVLKAVVAIPVYVAALPFLQLCGHHLFMKYLTKVCDHLGRFLAVFGIHPVTNRDM